MGACGTGGIWRFLLEEGKWKQFRMNSSIVEKIQTDIPYVPNDVQLCKDGILLYGTNACGKSTLMRIIAGLLNHGMGQYTIKKKN